MARILVVDDDDTSRRVLSEMLETLGHIVTQAENGKYALKRYHCESPDVIITDIVMPEMDGLELIRNVRLTGSDVGILAVAGMGMLVRDEVMDAGADRLVGKPFRMAELEDAVAALLRK